MGIEIQVTNVNKEAGFISFTQNGESKTAEVVGPSNVKYAKIGKAEAGFTPEGQINFLKSLEPKTQNTTNNYNSYPSKDSYPKKENTHRATSTVEILEGVNLKEFKAVYDELNATDGKKCGASTLYRRPDGAYDATLFVTTFTKLSEQTGTNAEGVDTASLM